MLSGGMAGGDMMGSGMMADGMMDQNATPEAADEAPTVTAEPETTAEATEEAAPESAAATSGHPDHPLAVETHSATAGAVTVEVVPLTDDEILEIAFAITLDTHSVALTYDLAEQASLAIGDAEFIPTSWEHDAADGHHVTGTLHFTIDLPAHTAMGELGEVTLDLGEIDGQPVTLDFSVE